MGQKQRKNREDNLIKYKPGESGNPNGRPKGALSFTTLYRKAIENIAASKNISPEEFEVQLVTQAITKGFNGDRSFYADTMDRVHGKAIQSVDHTTNGESINAPAINSALVQEYEEKLRLKMLNGDTTRTS